MIFGTIFICFFQKLVGGSGGTLFCYDNCFENFCPIHSEVPVAVYYYFFFQNSLQSVDSIFLVLTLNLSDRLLLRLYSSILYLTGSSTNVPYYTNIKRYINLCDFDSFNVNLCTRFFISNRVAQGIKNGLKVKQLSKQPPTLKTLMQKILFGLWVRNFNFSILSSLKLNFSHNCFWHNLIVYNNI